MRFHYSDILPFEESGDRLMLDSLENLMRVVGCENSSVAELYEKGSGSKTHQEQNEGDDGHHE